MRPADIKEGEFYATYSWSRVGQRKVQVIEKLAGEYCQAQAKNFGSFRLHCGSIQCLWSDHTSQQKKSKQQREMVRQYVEAADAEREMATSRLASNGIAARITPNGGPRYNLDEGRVEGGDTRLSLTLRDLIRLFSSVPEAMLADLDADASLITDHEQLQKLIQGFGATPDALDALLGEGN